MKTYIYFQSDKVPGRYFGVMIQLGKVYDTKENVEKVLKAQKLRFYSTQKTSLGHMLYTLVRGE